jgi:hypothetical protein
MGVSTDREGVMKFNITEKAIFPKSISPTNPSLHLSSFVILRSSSGHLLSVVCAKQKLNWFVVQISILNNDFHHKPARSFRDFGVFFVLLFVYNIKKNQILKPKHAR